MTLQIIKATLLDISDIMHLEKECFGADAWTILDLTYALSRPSGHRVKALLNNVFVGFAAGEKHLREKIGWITTVGVRPDVRGQGIGTKLIQNCEENLGLPKIRLTVDVHNVNAIRLYESLHYKPIEIWTRYYANGHDALLMEKIL